MIRFVIVLCVLLQCGHGTYTTPSLPTAIFNQTTGSGALLKSSFREQNRIIHGNPVTILQAPYMVSIRLNDRQHMCGGSIVTPYHVLTAAHCVDPHTINTRQLVLGYGSEQQRRMNLTSVQWTVIHPRWSRSMIRYDAGVIKVASPFPIGQGIVQKISLVRAGRQPRDGQSAIIQGWGIQDTSADSGSAPKLMALNVQLLSTRTCKKYYPDIGTDVICTKAERRKQGVCLGDSGSPLVSATTSLQVGIASFVTTGCATGVPDGYTNIADSIINKFITKMLKK